MATPARLDRLPAKESHGTALQESLRRYPMAVCVSVWHFGLTQSKNRALNSPVVESVVASQPRPNHRSLNSLNRFFGQPLITSLSFSKYSDGVGCRSTFSWSWRSVFLRSSSVVGDDGWSDIRQS